MTTDHGWPTDPTDHLFGPWMTQTRTSQYRVCVHPTCQEVEEREAPNG